MKPKMLIDIDGTIAGRNIAHFIEICNALLGLGMDREKRPRYYKAFLRSPQVKEYIQHVGQEKALRELAWIDLDPVVLAHMHVLPGAVEGVNRLAQAHVEMAYYTARSCWFDVVKDQAIQKATIAWLREKGFPEADKTVFCRNTADKLQRIVDVVSRDYQPVVLIDDQYHRLQEAFRNMDSDTQALLHSLLTLVAFGHDGPVVAQEEQSLPCIGLPGWSQCDVLTKLFVCLSSVSFL